MADKTKKTTSSSKSDVKDRNEQRKINAIVYSISNPDWEITPEQIPASGIQLYHLDSGIINYISSGGSGASGIYNNLYVDVNGYVAINDSPFAFTATDFSNVYYGGATDNRYLHASGFAIDLELYTNHDIKLWGGELLQNNNTVIESDGTIGSGLVTTLSIEDYAVTGAKIADESINGGHIQDDAVNANHILDGTVGNAELAAGAVTETKIGTGAVTNTKIGTGAVTTDKILDDAVTGDKIADRTVSGINLALPTNTFNLVYSVYSEPLLDEPQDLSANLTWTDCATEGITHLNNKPIWKIASSSTANLVYGDFDYSIYNLNTNEGVYILSAWIYADFDGTVTVSAKSSTDATMLTGSLATISGQWTRAHYYATSVAGEEDNNGYLVINNTANGSPVYLTKIQVEESTSEDHTEPSKYINNGYNAYGLSSLNYGNSSVDSNAIGSNAVTSNKIQDGAVTEAKIGTGAVTNTKLGTNSVTASKIAASAVDTSELATGAVETIKIADYNVTNIKLESCNEGSNFIEQRMSIPNAGTNYGTWSTAGTNAITVDRPAIPLHEREAFKVDANGTSYFVNDGNKSYIGPLADKTEIIVSFWTFGENQIDDIDVYLYANDDTLIGSVQQCNADNLTWNRQSIVFTIDYDCTGAYLVLGNPSLTYDFYFTAVMVEMIGKDEKSHTIASAYSRGNLAGYVDTYHLVTDAVTSTKIADDAITNAKIASSAVASGQLASDSVTTTKILDGAVTWEKTSYVPRGVQMYSSAYSKTTGGASDQVYTTASSTFGTYAIFQSSLEPEYNQIVFYAQMQATALSVETARLTVSGLLGVVPSTYVELTSSDTSYTVHSGIIDVSSYTDFDILYGTIELKTTAGTAYTKNMIVNKNAWNI